MHLIVDNYATHKHAKVKAWLARRPRYHIHYTPTYASWLNQVERWFGIITQQAIRRGTFSSVKKSDPENQPIRGQLQCQDQPIRLDSDSRINHREDRKNMHSYFWDSTLAELVERPQAGSNRRCSSIVSWRPHLPAIVPLLLSFSCGQTGHIRTQRHAVAIQGPIPAKVKF